MYKKLMMSVLIALGLCSGVVMGSAEVPDSEAIAIFLLAQQNNVGGVRIFLHGKSVDYVNARYELSEALSFCVGEQSLRLPVGSSTTFLHVAAIAEAYEVVEALLDEFGANPCGVAGRSIRTPLHLACIKAGLHYRALRSSFPELPFRSTDGFSQECIVDKIPLNIARILDILSNRMLRNGVNSSQVPDIYGFTVVDLIQRAAHGEPLSR